MKTHRIIIALFLFSLALTSCTKDTIKDLPEDEKLLSTKFVADNGKKLEKTSNKKDE